MHFSFIQKLAQYRGHHIISLLMMLCAWRIISVSGEIISFTKLDKLTALVPNVTVFVLANIAFLTAAAITCSSWLIRSIRNLLALRSANKNGPLVQITPNDLVTAIKLSVVTIAFTFILFDTPAEFIKSTLRITPEKILNLMNGLLLLVSIVSFVGSTLLLKRQVKI